MGARGAPALPLVQGMPPHRSSCAMEHTACLVAACMPLPSSAHAMFTMCPHCCRRSISCRARRGQGQGGVCRSGCRPGLVSTRHIRQASGMLACHGSDSRHAQPMQAHAQGLHALTCAELQRCLRAPPARLAHLHSLPRDHGRPQHIGGHSLHPAGGAARHERHVGEGHGCRGVREAWIAGSRERSRYRPLKAVAEPSWQLPSDGQKDGRCTAGCLLGRTPGAPGLHLRASNQPLPAC